MFYSRRLGGLPLFTRIRGSPVVSGGVVGPAAFAALLGGVLEFYSQRDPAFQEYFDTSMNHPYPYQVWPHPLPWPSLKNTEPLVLSPALSLTHSLALPLSGPRKDAPSLSGTVKEVIIRLRFRR